MLGSGNVKIQQSQRPAAFKGFATGAITSRSLEKAQFNRPCITIC